MNTQLSRVFEALRYWRKVISVLLSGISFFPNEAQLIFDQLFFPFCFSDHEMIILKYKLKQTGLAFPQGLNWLTGLLQFLPFCFRFLSAVCFSPQINSWKLIFNFKFIDILLFMLFSASEISPNMYVVDRCCISFVNTNIWYCIYM